MSSDTSYPEHGHRGILQGEKPFLADESGGAEVLGGDEGSGLHGEFLSNGDVTLYFTIYL
jgi:hypothetical protein